MPPKQTLLGPVRYHIVHLAATAAAARTHRVGVRSQMGSTVTLHCSLSSFGSLVFTLSLVQQCTNKPYSRESQYYVAAFAAVSYSVYLVCS